MVKKSDAEFEAAIEVGEKAKAKKRKEMWTKKLHRAISRRLRCWILYRLASRRR